ncbi:MAG: chromosomal replication initiator protein DnaA [Acidimicrobiales bacterium]
MSDLTELWAACSANLRHQVPEPTWNAWLAPLVPLEASGSHFVLAAPNSMVRELVLTRFQPLIQQVLAEATSIAAPDLELVVRPGLDEPGPEDPVYAAGAVSPASSGSASTSPAGAPWPLAAAAPAQPPAASYTPPRSTPVGQPARTDRRDRSSLNPRYTFEAFVIGASNRFAHAAAQRVAEEPAKAYNPLFIYGASGLGKTHMLHAIGHYVYQNFPGLNVCYVSTETFLNEFIDSIRTHGQTAFKRRYRAYDVLAVDDIQLLEGKKETQEEFFYTFNSFYEAEKQIVISSDRHPRAIATLEDRLRSRFESGLITDIQPPELETRLAILRKKSEGERLTVPEHVLELIATHIKDNIRELEGALIRLSAFASIHRVPVTAQLAQDVLSDVIAASAPKQVTARQILEATAKMFDLTVEEVCGPSRRRPLVAARQTAMYLFRELTDYSYPAIAREFGDRDHTTVMHAQKKIARLMGEKRQIYEQVTDLIHKIKAGG